MNYFFLNSDMEKVVTLKHSCKSMHTNDDGLDSGSFAMKFLLLLRFYTPDVEYKIHNGRKYHIFLIQFEKYAPKISTNKACIRCFSVHNIKYSPRDQKLL